MALDPNLAALLTVSVDWQAKTGLDKNGQDTWGAAVTLKCYPSFGARQIQNRDGTIYTSAVTLLFDASNAHVQTFKLGDKFTAPGIAGGQAQEAREIETSYSPGPSLNEAMSQWLVEVVL